MKSIQSIALEQHGGLRGLRDAGALEFALAGARRHWHDEAANDLTACAAAYGIGVAKHCAFIDGNKRTAFQAMFVFLASNSIDLVAKEVDAVTTMFAVASGEMNEAALADWLRDNTTRRRRKR